MKNYSVVSSWKPVYARGIETISIHHKSPYKARRPNAAVMHSAFTWHCFTDTINFAATWVAGGYINGTCEGAFSGGFLRWSPIPIGYALSLLIGTAISSRNMKCYKRRPHSAKENVN